MGGTCKAEESNTVSCPLRKPFRMKAMGDQILGNYLTIERDNHENFNEESDYVSYHDFKITVPKTPEYLCNCKLHRLGLIVWQALSNMFSLIHYYAHRS